MKKTLLITVLALVISVLTACGGGMGEVEVAQKVVAAREGGAIAEAARADAKLDAAKTEMSRLAIETARQGGYSSSANCNVLPQSFAGKSASHNFPSNAPLLYKEACVKEVVVMNAERKANASRAIAQAKAHQAKLAAKKAKAEQLAAEKKAKPAKHGNHKVANS